jgi:hypothetical protein
VNNGQAEGTTTFTSSTEGPGYKRDTSGFDPMNDHDLEVDDIKDIADFLAKPMPVSSGTFTTANSAGDTLLSADIFALFNAQTIWTNKIQGFLNMRANVKLRLVINPTPFQAGLLRLSYFPCANWLQFEMRAHLLNRMCISQIPGSYLNLNSNFVEVTVPYVAPTSFIERDRVAGGAHVSWGQALIHVFEPLRTGTGPTSINWTLWMSLEDLELSGMVQPQMAEAPRKRKGRAPQDQEQNSGKGPITRIMSSGVQLASDIARIPSLAPIATPASWVLSAIEGLCESFGWSKPTLTEGPCRQIINDNAGAVHTKGNSSDVPLSLDPDNKIQVITDAAPGQLDEMSTAFVHSRWSFFADIAWSTASVAGAAISQFDLGPATFQLSQVVGGNTVTSSAPCAVANTMYAMYRGSFEVRIRLIKTGFHTGTLAVAYIPGMDATTPSYADSAYVYRQIIDIQDGSEFIFNCPYLIPQDYLRTSEKIGRFVVYVVNPLIAPATVSTTVDLMLEVRGGSDLMYSVPNALDVCPFVPQGIDVENAGESTSLVLGSRDHQLANVHHSALSVGEVQLSYLEILKSHYNLLWADNVVTATSGNDYFQLATNRIYGARYNGVTTTSAELGADLISFVGSWYALSRGSQRYRAIPLTPPPLVESYRAAFMSDDVNDSVAGLSGLTWWTNTVPNLTSSSAIASLLVSDNPIVGTTAAGKSTRVYQTPPVNSGISVQAPFYCKFRYGLNAFVVDRDVANIAYTPNNSVGFYMPSCAKTQLTRSLGDDFQFSYFVGIPCFVRSGGFFNKNA